MTLIAGWIVLNLMASLLRRERHWEHECHFCVRICILPLTSQNVVQYANMTLWLYLKNLNGNVFNVVYCHESVIDISIMCYINSLLSSMINNGHTVLTHLKKI